VKPVLQILELFGGIGSPRIALRNLGIPTKSIDYVEIDQKAVDSYNAIFANELPFKTQSVINWNLKPDILIHGSPCQDISIAGHQKGADEGSETRSSLMWETIKIIRDMGMWKPRIVIWENVKGVLHKHMRKNFNRYLDEMEKLGYSNSFELLDARDFGLPQARQRVFTISVLNQEPFNFQILNRKPMQNIKEFLLNNDQVDPIYNVTQPSVLSVIGKTGIKRATVIQEYAYTITTRQDRTPAQVIDCGNDRFRYLTELECWRLQGYSDDDYFAAASTVERNGRFRMPMYKQSGNSIPVGIFESLFEVLI
jgi:DNA (cytosine-5)-methyltransferase 1